MNWYEELWEKIGGRPWTYIMRDGYHNAPLPSILIVLAVGAVIGHYTGFLTFLKILGILLIGILMGHLFWGTKWIEGQPGEDTDGDAQTVKKVKHDKEG
jgi:hypothetical protein